MQIAQKRTGTNNEDFIKIDNCLKDSIDNAFRAGASMLDTFISLGM